VTTTRQEETMKTEPVKTTDLQVGDLVYAHGCVVRLTAVNQRWTDERTGRPVVNFQTEYVSGTADWPDVHGWITRGEYRIQGNDLATEARVLSEVGD
jgi:hypothetical protein